jgi:thiol-disulfide isomerase/thioredoxin
MHPILNPPGQPTEPDDDGLPEPQRPRRFHPGAILLVLLVVGLGLGGWKYAHSGDGWIHDFDEGVTASRESGKPMLVFYTADWCPPCRQLKATVLADATVNEGLAERFVRVKVDLTDQMGPNVRLAAEYGVHAIPTMILYDASGNERERVTGGGDLADWLYAKAAG